MIELTGITWNHSRGYLPMVATAQRFSELRPDVAIRWEKRSLQNFADFPVEKLAESYDLLVIDHPFAGHAADHNLLLRLDEHLPPRFLEDQARNSVGLSHRSYRYQEHQWALAIDAAAPVSGFRPDLLERAGLSVPRTWPELLELAARRLVAVPGKPIDSLMNFYMLCSSLGETPFGKDDRVVSVEIGLEALTMLRELMSLCAPECFDRNPIATWELLSSGDSAAYCPFAYGYSNYARRGYAWHILRFSGLIGIGTRGPCRSTLGGAGLAVSSRCRNREAAVDYVKFVAAPECQVGLYFQVGGQPGHRSAWLDDGVNRQSHDFFRDTLETLDAAYLRPRFNGYMRFQDEVGPLIYEYLRQPGDARQVLDQMSNILRASRVNSAALDRTL
jgi:multiple sugar transport system substrate-binding protein